MCDLNLCDSVGEKGTESQCEVQGFPATIHAPLSLFICLLA